jgi:hypothetical protein
VTPLIQTRQRDAAFVMGFSWQLYHHACQGRFPREEAFDLLRNTARSILKSFKASQLVSLELFQREQSRREQWAWIRTRTPLSLPPPPVTSETLTSFCKILLDLGMQDDLRSFAHKLSQQDDINEEEFYPLNFPFLRGLMGLLASHSEALFSDPIFRRLYSTIIVSFWDKHVGGLSKVKDVAQRGKSLNDRVLDTRANLQGFNQHHLSMLLGSQYERIMGVPPPHNPSQVAVPAGNHSFAGSPSSRSAPQALGREPLGPLVHGSQQQVLQPPQTVPETHDLHHGPLSRHGSSGGPDAAARVTQEISSDDDDCVIVGTKRKYNGVSDPVRDRPFSSGR